MKNTISLSYIKLLQERIDSNNGLIQVLLGPRQVGKTTTILKLIEEQYSDQALYYSTDQVFNPDASWIREKWIEAQSTRKILFIDEIQKIHNWSEAIKSLYDQSRKEKHKIACVLLGSSSLEIHKGLTESLTGRFQLLRAYHWNYQESQEGYQLNFEEYLQFGGYPGSYQFIHTKDWVDYVKNSIITTVVEKDILQFQTVKNPALFRQAFDLLISYPAQEISYTKLLGQLQDKGNVEIIKHYISLYEGAYLIKALEKFSNKIILRKGSSPKILPLAPCLPYLQIRADYQPEEEGRIFELIVGAQLVRTGEDLYYWRDGKYEVDYVLQQGRNLWAIEVKAGRKRSASGLEQFKKRFPSAKLVLITKDNYLKFEFDPMEFLKNHSL